MAVQTLPWIISGQTHNTEVVRNQTAALLGAPTTTFTNAVGATTAGGSHGVVAPGDFAVTQNGTPNMSVNVAAGKAFIRGGNAASTTSGVYSVLNDATVNVAISAADPTNPRIDLVVVQVRNQTEYAEAANDVRITVITGTPAAIPAVPSLTLFPNALVLAQVAVAAAAASITNANITDKRTRAAALGGTQVCTSTTRPSGSSLGSGLEIWETDTNRVLRYDGTGWIIMAEPPVAYTPTLTNLTNVNGTLGFFYHRSDGFIDYYGRFTLGSSSTVTGLPGFSLPVAATSGAGPLVALATFGDSGTTVYHAYMQFGTPSRVDLYAMNVSGTYSTVSVPSAIIPMTWTTSDYIDFAVRYQMTTRYS